jgi:hypothetical protein
LHIIRHDCVVMVRQDSVVMPVTVSGVAAKEGGLRPPRVKPLAGLLRSLRSLRPPRR